ncbi:hypothetical protein ABK040_008035 [Willaertia magna]
MEEPTSSLESNVIVDNNASNNNTSTTTPTKLKKKLTEEEKRELLRRKRMAQVKQRGDTFLKDPFSTTTTANNNNTTTNIIIDNNNTTLPINNNKNPIIVEEEEQTSFKTPVKSNHATTNNNYLNSTNTPNIIGMNYTPITPMTPETPNLSNQLLQIHEQEISTIPHIQSPTPNQLLFNKKKSNDELFERIHDINIINKEEQEFTEPYGFNDDKSVNLITNKERDNKSGEQDKKLNLNINLLESEQNSIIDNIFTFLDKFRPLFILILSLYCSISFIKNNNFYNNNTNNTIFSNNYSQIVYLMTFEILFFITSLLFGKSILNMHNFTNILDILLFLKALHNSIIKFIGDICLFLCVWMVVYSFHQIQKDLYFIHHMMNEIPEPVLDIVSVLHNVMRGIFFSED